MNRRHGQIVRDIASRIGYENGDMDYVGSRIYDYFSDYNIWDPMHGQPGFRTMNRTNIRGGAGGIPFVGYVPPRNN